MNQVLKALVVSTLLLLFCNGCGDDDCDSCPGEPGGNGSAPTIASLQCDPTSAEIGAGGGAVTVDCTVDFIDQDLDLDRIRFSAQNCGAGDWVHQDIDVYSQAAGKGEGTIEFTVHVNTNCHEPGDYPYRVSALDKENNESNALELVFTLTAPEGESE